MSFAVRAIRNERFKYVWNPQDRDELYDLANDPYEMENLAGQPAPATVEDRPSWPTDDLDGRGR